MANGPNLLSGRVPVVPLDQLTADRYQFLALGQAEPNLGNGVANSILTIQSNGNRVWANSITLTTANFSGNVSAPWFIGNIDAANIRSPGANTQILFNDGGLVAGNTALTFNKATSLLTVAGDSIITGNLTVQGNVSYINVTNLNIQDPIVGIGRGANNTPLVTDDGKDRGEQLWYYNNIERSAFIGFDNSAANLLMAIDVTIANEIVTVNNFGNVTIGNLSGQSIIASANISAVNVTATGFVSATGNITSSANVNGANVISSGLISATGNITSSANIIGGNMSSSGNVAATGNVTGGNVTSAGIISATGTVSGGNLSTSGLADVGRIQSSGNAVVSGNLSGANITTAGLISATGNITGGNLVTTGIANIATLAVTGNATVNGTAQITGNTSVTANLSAGNITSGNRIGTVDLNVTGNASIANISGNINITGNITAGGNLQVFSLTATANVTGGNLTTAGTANIGRLEVTGDAIFKGNITGNVTVTGNLTTTGNLTVNDLSANTVTANANIVGGNLNTDGLVFAAGNVTGGNITTVGQVAAGGNITTTANVSGGNLNTPGKVTADGNISGSNLTTPGQVVATANVSGGNLTTPGKIDATGNITTSGNVSASFYQGNGYFLTGIITSVANINNGSSNVRIDTSGGNILANVGGVANVFAITPVGANVTGNLAATGNVFAGYFFGNVVGNISGNITVGGANTQVLFNDNNLPNATAGFTFDKATNAVTMSGNATAANFTTTGTANISTLEVTTLANIKSTTAATSTTSGALKTAGGLGVVGNAYIGGLIAATGNVSAGNVTTSGIGNIGTLAVVGNSTIGGTQTVTGNLTAANLNTAGLVAATGNVTGGNLNTAGLVAATGNVTGGNLTTAGVINSTGNITGGNIISNGIVSTNNVVGSLSNVTVTAGNYVTTFNNTGNVSFPGNTTATSNVIGGNLTTGGQVVATGNITGGNVGTGGLISASGNVTGGNLNTGGLVSATGNVTGGNLITTGIANIGTLEVTTLANIKATTAATSTTSGALKTAGGLGVAGNAYIGGLIAATGNVTGGNLTTAGIGNIGTLEVTGTATVIGNVTGGNLTTTGTANIATLAVTGSSSFAGNVTGNLNVTGNIAGGNLLTPGRVVATSNVIGGNLTTTGTANIGTLAVTGNAAIAGNTSSGNISSAGNINATANVVGGNITTAGIANISTLEVTGTASVVGNTSSGNISTTGLINATGNVIGGNITTVGVVAATGNIISTANVIGGNLTTGGLVSATGNVIGGNLTTAGKANIGNLEVTGTATVIGNVTGGNLITAGLINATGNITGGNLLATGIANVTGNIYGNNIIARSNIEVLGNKIDSGTTTSLLFAPGNVSVVSGNIIVDGNYIYGLNGTGALNLFYNGEGGSVGVVNNLTVGADGVGNLTVQGLSNLAGNTSVTGTLSVTGNVSGGNITTAGLITSTGNITGGNLITSGRVVATGNINTTANVVAANVVTANINSTGGITIVTASNGDINLDPNGNGNVVLRANTFVNNVKYPVQDQDAASKIYVDNLASTSISYHDAVFAATAANLATATGGTITYAQPNGAGNGVGATITTTGSFNLIDTANVQTANTRILVKDEGNAVLNGIYVWSNTTVITRSADADTYGAANPNAFSINDYFFVSSGNVNKGSAYVVDAPSGTITFGTSNIQFAQFSSTQIYTAGNGIAIAGTIISAKVDNDTTAFDVTGNIIVKAGANLTTPNIGAATGVSLTTTGNITANNISANNFLAATTIAATGNITGGNINSNGVANIAGTVATGNLTVTGFANVSGNLSAIGNMRVGQDLSFIAAYANLQYAGTANSYVQLVAQNKDNGSAASTDFVATADNGTDIDTYIDLGINSSGYNQAEFGLQRANDGYLYVAGNTATGGGNLVLSTLENNDIIFSTGGANTGDEQGRFQYGNGFKVTGNIYSTGNVRALNFIGNVVGNIVGNITIPGPNTGVVFNDGGVANSLAGFTYDKFTNQVAATGNITANGNISGSYILGNGHFLTGVITSLAIINSGTSNVRIDGANGNILANVNGTANVMAISNTGLVITGNVTSNVGYFVGNGVFLTGVVAATSNSTGVTNINYGTSNVRIDLPDGNISANVGANANVFVIAPFGVTVSGTAGITGNITGGNLTTVGKANVGILEVTGNASANYYFGNGSQLTGVLNTYYSNINLGTSNIRIDTQDGPILANVGGVANVFVITNTGANVLGTFNATGNITGGNLTTVGIANVGTLAVTGAAIVTGNVTGGNIITAGNVTATGNVQGNYILGNGSQLTGISTDANKIFNGTSNVRIDTSGGNISANVGGTANVLIIASTGANITGYVDVTGNAIAGNLTTAGTANVGKLEATTTANVTGNLTAGNISTAGQVSATGNATVGNLSTAGLISATGNISSGNLNTIGLVSASGNITTVTGNVSGSYILGNGYFLTGVITSVANINNGSSNVRIDSAGGNVLANVGGVANVFAITPIGANVSGNLAVTGNVSANYFLGNGSQLTGIVSTTDKIANGTSNVRIDTSGGNIQANVGGVANVFLIWADGANVTGNLNATANITGGNIITTGIANTGTLIVTGTATITGNANVTANIAGGNISTAGRITATSNVTGGNLTTTGIANIGTLAVTGAATVTGNVTGGNLTTAGIANVGTLAVTGAATVTGNVTGGNITTSGQVVATGNVTGGNLMTSGSGGNITGANVISATTFTATGNVSGSNLTTTGIANIGTLAVTGNGNISGNLGVVGNVSANYFLGNGSQLTGISTNTDKIFNGTSNVRIDTSGGNILANVGGTANVFAITPIGANVTGNLGVSGNVSAGFFLGSANATNLVSGTVPSARLTGTYAIDISGLAARANTVTDAAQPNITSVGTLTSLTVTGNVAGGNLTTGGLVLATGNITGGNLTTAGIIKGKDQFVMDSGPSEGAQIVLAWPGVTGLFGQANGTWNIDVDSSNTFRTFYQNASGQAGVPFTLYPGNSLAQFSSNVSASYYFGNGSQLTGVVAAAGANIVNGTSNVSIPVANGNVNTSVGGTANVLVVTSTGANVAGTFDATGNITGGNVTTTGIANIGTLAVTGNATVAGTAIVTGNVTGGNLITTGLVVATGTITATANIVGGNLVTAGIASIGGNITTGANANVGNVNATGIVSAAGNVIGGNISTTGIANIGTLTVTGDGLISGNLTVNGNTNYVNVTNLNIQDPIIGIGRGANNAPLVTNDNKDRGEQLWYYSDSEKSSFIGYDNSAGNLIAAVDATITAEVVTVNSYGNFVVGTLAANTVNATGTINATSNVTGGNITTGGQVVAIGNIQTSNYYIGNGAFLSGIASITSVYYELQVQGNTTGNAAGNATLTASNSSGILYPRAGNGIAMLGNATTNVLTITVAGSTNDGTLWGAGGDCGLVTAGTTPPDYDNGLVNAGVVDAYDLGVIIQTSPGGANGTVQFNLSNENFGGDDNFTWDTNTSNLYVGGNATFTGSQTVGGNATVTGTQTVTGNITGGNLTTAGVLTVNSGNAATAIINGGSNAVGNIGSSSKYFNTVFAKSTSAQYADLAEIYDTDIEYQPGTVMIIGGIKQLTQSTMSHDSKVVGVISDKPAYLMNTGVDGQPLALTGKVRCLIKGSVTRGDLLVSSDMPGYAQVLDPALYQVGCVFGKSLEDFNGDTGKIWILVGRY